MRNWLKKYMPDHSTVSDNRWLAPFRNTLLHPRLWHINRRSTAGGVAAGLFCGLLPAPFQMVSAAACAVVFRINLPLAILTTLYTNPFTIVPLYMIAYGLGSLMIGSDDPFIAPPAYTSDLMEWLPQLFTWLGQLGLPLVVGTLGLASALAAAGYLAIRLSWRVYLVRAWHHRRIRRTQAPVA